MNPTAVSEATATSIESIARRSARWTCLVLGILLTVVSYGLAREQIWAIDLWPWEDVRLTYIFLASIGMAIAAPLIWVAVTNELAGLEPFALEIGVDTLIIGGYFGLRWYRHDESALAGIVVSSALVGVLTLAVYRWCRRIPLLDQRAMPRYVRLAFTVFIIVLIPVGTAMVLQVADVFPWRLLPQTSTVIGFIFLGAALLFAWIWLNPSWAYAGPALASFLAYDLALYVPYVDLLVSGDASDVNTNSLVAYLTVLVFSTVIAAYALFIDRRTRVWARA